MTTLAAGQCCSVSPASTTANARGQTLDEEQVYAAAGVSGRATVTGLTSTAQPRSAVTIARTAGATSAANRSVVAVSSEARMKPLVP